MTVYIGGDFRITGDSLPDPGSDDYSWLANKIVQAEVGEGVDSVDVTIRESAGS